MVQLHFDEEILFDSVVTAKGLERLASQRRRLRWNRVRQHVGQSQQLPKADFLLASDTGSEEANHVNDYLFKVGQKAAVAVKKIRAQQFLPAALPYMDEDALRYWQSLFSELLVFSVFEYDYNHCLQRKQLKAGSLATVQYYLDTLGLIEAHLEGNAPAIEPRLWSTNNEGVSPTVLGFSLKNWLNEQFGSLQIAPSAALRGWMDEINWHRLYWVWTGGNGGLLGSFFELPTVQRFLTCWQEAYRKLEVPKSFFGYASWMLYYTRFCVHIGLLLKHTLPNPWLSEREQQISWLTRLQAQWDQRKFVILNDIIWGTINLATIYWLTDSVSPLSGAIGGVATIGLMLFDVLVAEWELKEARVKFHKAEARVKQKIAYAEEALNNALSKNGFNNFEQVLARRNYLRLQEELKGIGLSEERRQRLNARLVQFEERAKEGATLEQCQRIIALERTIHSLGDEKDLLEFNWQFQKKQLEMTIFLTWIFVGAMVLMYAPIFPVLVPALALSAAVAANTVFVGCVMSVLLTALQSAYDYEVEIQKSQAIIAGIEIKQQAIAEKHSGLSKQRVLCESEHNDLRLCHLENKRLHASKLFHQAQTDNIRLQQWHSVGVQIVFPFVVLLALCLPTPATIALIGCFLALAVASKAKLKAMAPDEVENGEILLTAHEYNAPTSQLAYSSRASAGAQIGAVSSPRLGRYGLFRSAESYQKERTCQQQRDMGECFELNTAFATI